MNSAYASLNTLGFNPSLEIRTAMERLGQIGTTPGFNPSLEIRMLMYAVVRIIEEDVSILLLRFRQRRGEGEERRGQHPPFQSFS